MTSSIAIKNDKHALDLLIEGKITAEDVKNYRLNKKKSPGRSKKILLEDPDVPSNNAKRTRAEKAMLVWAYWLRLEGITDITQMKKRELISKLLHISDGTVDREITNIIKMQADPDIVILITGYSVSISHKKDIEQAQFANKLGVDPLDQYIKIEMPKII